MRTGATYKNVRRRKSGGGDVYIEESVLKSMGLGEKVQFSTHPIDGQHAVLIKFRRSRDD